ncbi:MAG: helix-turn-helix domain-containing protein [Treponema sp.]|jgi:transcriptional regulator with XRE-family HTH domain|nr:helix-turn-helix domain-containing protein [Treponema sp.]
MSESPGETVNSRLARIREALKKSPADFAGVLGVSRSYIYELEKGRRLVNDRIISLICFNFGVRERWLKTGEGEMFADPEGENRRRIAILFDRLRPDFQEYVLRHIDLLLELQDKTI